VYSSTALNWCIELVSIYIHDCLVLKYYYCGWCNSACDKLYAIIYAVAIRKIKTNHKSIMYFVLVYSSLIFHLIHCSTFSTLEFDFYYRYHTRLYLEYSSYTLHDCDSYSWNHRQVSLIGEDWQETISAEDPLSAATSWYRRQLVIRHSSELQRFEIYS